MSEPEKRCGTCKWFHEINRYGDCKWPLPYPMPPCLDVHRFIVRGESGTECPCWQEREEAKNNA